MAFFNQAILCFVDFIVQKEICLKIARSAAAPNYYQRGGISMTEDEAYKVHIQYTFNAFCNGYVIDKNEYLGEPYLTFGIRLIKTLM